MSTAASDTTLTRTQPIPTPPADIDLGIGPGPRSRAWPVLPLALIGWFAGLVPWFVARQTVPTFGTPSNPRNDMRDALLPFHDQQLVLLVTVVLMAGTFAGLAPLWLSPRTGRRAAAFVLTILGAIVALGAAVGQTVWLRPDIAGSGAEERRVLIGIVGLSVAGTVLGLAIGLLVSLAGPAFRAFALAVAGVVTSAWVGLLVVNLPTNEVFAAVQSQLQIISWAVAGVVAGLGLAGLGLRPVGRVLSWVVAFGLLWVFGQAFIAARRLLEQLRGTGADLDRVRDLARDAVTAFASSLRLDTVPWEAIGAAVAVGLVGVIALRRREPNIPW